MFISNKEKEEMRIAIRALRAEVKDLQSELLSLKVHKFIRFANTTGTAPSKRQGHAWSSESKRAASERMKKYWADKKAKKETS